MSKGRKQSKESKLLELSMDTQCVLMNTKDKQQLRELIDIQDDLRRDEFRENIKEKLLDLHEALENEDIYKAKKGLLKLESFLEREFEKEDYYEQLDDENREITLDYLKDRTEKIKNFNFIIEKELIKK